MIQKNSVVSTVFTPKEQSIYLSIYFGFGGLVQSFVP